MGALEFPDFRIGYLIWRRTPPRPVYKEESVSLLKLGSDIGRRRVVGLPIRSGCTVQDMTLLGYRGRSFLFRRGLSGIIFYYCTDELSSRLFQRTITDSKTGAGFETQILLPPRIHCGGHTLGYHSSRSAIIFPFSEDGIMGVVEVTVNP